LTNLPNRQNLNEWLSKEMEQAQSGKAEGVVLFVDLDELKMVNDTYGHTYGDKIIVASGCRITEVLGKDTFVARIGGDEFVAVLQGTYQHEQIVIIMEKISKVLSQKQEYLGMSFHITASIGIACYPSDGNTVDEIIKNADNAMFAAKRNGKNCWQFYNQGMQSEAYMKIRLIEKLRCALDRGEFSLLYQPQISIPQRAVIGFEALLRWKNSEYGSVPPLRFIPLAEQSGLIHRIGEWVLREACFFARRLVDQGWANIRVAINVSAKQVSTDDFVAIVCSAVNAAGIEPQQLDIEITESVFMTSMDDAIRKLEQLKKFGVHLSLDDFGTGFSSLTYLRLLPFDTLKIDKTFIDLIETDYQGANIIDTIISMAQMNNMSVVAEGVETEKQLEYLINKKCDCIQGYLFSKPSVEATVVEMLSKEMQLFVP
jgi:diguanylate cyclase (GGDEF)-like protein